MDLQEENRQPRALEDERSDDDDQEGVDEEEDEEQDEQDEEWEDEEGDLVAQAEERRRRRTIVDQCCLTLRSWEQQHSRAALVEAVASFVGDYGGDGDLLWEVVRELGEPTESIFNVCASKLPLEIMGVLLRRLLLDHPVLLSKRGPFCGTLLHMAATMGDAQVDLIRLLVDLNRDGVMIQDWEGSLPIHVALAPQHISSPCLEKVRVLAGADLSALDATDDDGKLPLHLACQRLTAGGPKALEVVRWLVDARPEALVVSNGNGQTPVIAVLLLLGPLSPQVLQLLQDMIRKGGSKSVRTARTMSDGATLVSTALHAACNYCLNAELLETLIAACRTALSDEDIQLRLPLHCACWRLSIDNGAQAVAAVRLLMDEFPQVLEATDNQGSTPIMTAIRNRLRTAYYITPQVLQLLKEMIRRAPGAVRIAHPNLGGAVDVRTALSLACFYCPNVELVSSLIEACPDAVSTVDVAGDTPLHCACKRAHLTIYPQIPELIQLLIDEFPQALEAKNQRGMTPIILAIYCNPRIARERNGVPSPEILQLLQEMIRRAPGSARPTVVERDGTAVTALSEACRLWPSPPLVAALIEAHPAALCVSLTRGLASLSREIAPSVTSEACAAFLALVEVLLHESTGGVVPDEIRDRVRRLAADSFVPPPVDATNLVASGIVRLLRFQLPGFHVEMLRSEILDDPALQEFLRTREDFQDLVNGVYRMNKAGRGVAQASVVSAERQVRVLQAARGDLSSLFLHLRDCGSLFARVGSEEGRATRTTAGRTARMFEEIAGDGASPDSGGSDKKRARS